MADNAQLHGIEFEIKGNADKGAKALQSFSNMLQRIGNVSTSARSKLGGFTKSTNIASPIKNMTDKIKGATKAVDNFNRSIGRIVMYRAIRSAIKAITDGFKEGTDNLYQYSQLVGTNFAPAMDQIATSLLYLKNSLGALVGPLLETLAPALDVVVDKFVSLTNAVGQAMAALTGKTFSRAIKYPTEYAKAVDGATKAQKKFLLGIDELNIFDPTSGGGTKTTEDFSKMFEEVDTGQFDSLGEAFNEFVDTLNSGLPDLETSLSGFAEKVNGFAARVREAFKFKDVSETIDVDVTGEVKYKLKEGSIQTKIRNLGVRLAQTLNQFTGQISWTDIGGAIAGGFTSAINFLTGFLDKFDFTELGESLASGFNGFLEDMDWYALGEFIFLKFSGSIDTLAGLILGMETEKVASSLGSFLDGAVDKANEWMTTIPWDKVGEKIAELAGAALDKIVEAIGKFDWPTLAESVGDLLKGAMDGATKWLVGKDWKQIGLDIYAKLKETLDKMDFPGIAESVFNLLGEALTGATTLLGTFIGSVVADIKDWFAKKVKEHNGDLAEVGLDIIGGVITGIMETMANIGVWILQNVFQPFIDGFKNAFDIHSPSKEMEKIGGYVMEGFLNGLNSVWSKLTEWGGSIVNWFKGLFDNTTIDVPKVNTSNVSLPATSSGFTNNKRGGGFSGTYASGGFPDMGEMFIAREAGPELVGRIGNRTAVANNEQIAEGIAQAVSEGNDDVVATLYAITNTLVGAIRETDNNGGYTMSDRDIYRAWQRGSQGIGGALVQGV